MQSRDKFEIMIKLNATYNKSNMFMIHPGMIGSEVYAELAQKLATRYSCYGVDNYNIYHLKKIDNLQQLANHYLAAIDRIRKKTRQNNQSYYLLEWSLGGQIALEIASILEQRGHKNIKVILLDTFLSYGDDIISHVKPEKIVDKAKFKSYLIGQGYLPEYVDKVINNMDCENVLSLQNISNKLNYTKIILFKAMKKDKIKFVRQSKEFSQHVLGLPYNNVDKQVGDITNIKVVRLNAACHGDILNFSDQISTYI